MNALDHSFKFKLFRGQQVTELANGAWNLLDRGTAKPQDEARAGLIEV